MPGITAGMDQKDSFVGTAWSSCSKSCELGHRERIQNVPELTIGSRFPAKAVGTESYVCVNDHAQIEK